MTEETREFVNNVMTEVTKRLLNTFFMSNKRVCEHCSYDRSNKTVFNSTVMTEVTREFVNSTVMTVKTRL